MSELFQQLRQFWESRMLRYLFFGGLTVLVNMSWFFLLVEFAGWETDVANAISIMTAVLFAYTVNTWFVFRSKFSGFRRRFREFLRFLSARLFTMTLEFLCVHILTEVLFWNGFLSKLAIQIVVIVLNYVFSKTIVYKKV